ncbi:hypothetical protein Mtai_v1c29060 (plasmid) [Meiothermus taiwanensis WR-220]|uniref:DUF302 domain-containing protein n=5 Tax=Thermaceae TaxID=188786 RepID=D7BGS9_ALLS1|nr:MULTISPECIES: DUF302 domain-containing protein [Thermaceae]AWR88125.1 hypothetical protein Mtai_v1c29060 [Meiothermus taiwanensis WR-220]RIH76475.1 hypothetical protein Mcate_01747 [Meiothermus taiwanensis]RIH84981.1 hypothetical protein Mlute_01713 [Meiothermus luteus]ADH62083.1 protein of unknown function DUF302 [Allomeiothermus silvanus DSM 9946]GIW29816.1 MAG: hypothetical protein KatS3mg070_3179 [Meiothermus sp.]
MSNYAMKTILSGDLIEVRTRAVEALKAQGFGILSEIDVQKTLKEKLGLEYEPYLILGACNPNLARQALDTDRDIGLLLPCNVVLRQLEGEVEVSILDPEAMFSLTEEATRRQLEPLAQEARVRLSRALQTLEEAP